MEQQGQSSSTHPARGRRYSPAQRAEILKDAEEMGVAKAAEKHGCAPWTIYDWRHKAARRGTESLWEQHSRRLLSVPLAQPVADTLWRV
jgi:transposase-like protein